jgi:rhomboid protease GluP
MKSDITTINQLTQPFGYRRKSSNNRASFFDKTQKLTYTCCLFHFANYFTKDQILRAGSFRLSSILNGQVWRVLTFPFLHVNSFHLFSNIVGLNSRSPALEKKLSSEEYTTVIVLSIAVNALAFAIFKPLNYTVVGLSGFVYALYGAQHAIEVLESKKSSHVINRISFSLLSGFVIDIAVERIFKLKISHIAHASGYLAGFFYIWNLKSFKKDL